MPSPFPGMDPWLESPTFFPNLHQSMITYARDQLQERVGDRYFVTIGERVYIEEPDERTRSYVPDVFVTRRDRGEEFPLRESGEADIPQVLVLEAVERREVFLEIQDSKTGGAVLTVVELLSPWNKTPGLGRRLYRKKQRNVLRSTANLVEIDLLREGKPTVALPARKLGRREPYRVVVSPARDRSIREIYAVSVRKRLPRVAVPLRPGEPGVVLDLQAVLSLAYDRGAYRLRIDYTKPPEPPLEASDAAWAREVLAARARGQ